MGSKQELGVQLSVISLPISTKDIDSSRELLSVVNFCGYISSQMYLYASLRIYHRLNSA